MNILSQLEPLVPLVIVWGRTSDRVPSSSLEYFTSSIVKKNLIVYLTKMSDVTCIL